MGSCISKCRPCRNDPHEDAMDNNIDVQDKLVISQAPTSPVPSISSFSHATSRISSSNSTSFTSLSLPSSSSSSCSSSITTNSSKEKSFSNEFIWACVKENPHIIRVDPVKEPVMPNRVDVQKLNSLTKPNVAVPQKLPTPKKRPRANSPSTLTRQKSFRKEPSERANGAFFDFPSRAMRTPSPSRRINGENYNYKGALVDPMKEKRRSVVSKGSSGKYVGKENIRPATPNRNLSRSSGNLRNRETHTHHIGPKIDERRVEGPVTEDINPIPMEDIDNPLIALDCFIFL